DQFRTEAVVVNEITGQLPHSLIPRDFHNMLGAYELADPTYWKPQAIDFLLGADLYFDIITGGPFQVRPGSRFCLSELC
ncbi:hypothetical protein ACUWC3_28765, partial [Klebsiella pneumoniae]|uniref:hypothetical protein n=1 Tax=Klebsiella pneumoniae TaxID=573 RepID=UPI0040555B3D